MARLAWVLRLGLAVLGLGLVLPAVAGASVDRIVVGVSSGSPGVGASSTVTAVAENAAGQTDKSFQGPASWSDRSGHLTPGSPSEFVGGVSRTTGAAVSVPFHADQITVSGGGLSGTSGSINVIGPLDHFSFSPKLVNEKVNTSFTVDVYARDAAGNL